jgi:hypothetical protein
VFMKTQIKFWLFSVTLALLATGIVVKVTPPVVNKQIVIAGNRIK